MDRSMETTCRESGMAEENFNNLNRFFDREKKKLKYENETMKKNNIQYVLISELEADEYSQVMQLKDESVNVEEQAIEELDKSRLLECIQGLDTDEKMLLARYYWDGMSFRKIATELGLALSTVQNRHNKIIEKLRYGMGGKRKWLRQTLSPCRKHWT